MPALWTGSRTPCEKIAAIGDARSQWRPERPRPCSHDSGGRSARRPLTLEGRETSVADTAVLSESDGPTMRDFVFLATGAAAAVGLGSAVWPIVGALAPDAATVAAGAPVDLDLTP